MQVGVRGGGVVSGSERRGEGAVCLGTSRGKRIALAARVRTQVKLLAELGLSPEFSNCFKICYFILQKVLCDGKQ